MENQIEEYQNQIKELTQRITQLQLDNAELIQIIKRIDKRKLPTKYKQNEEDDENENEFVEHKFEFREINDNTKCLYDNELKQLNELNEKVKVTLQKEIEQLEKWSMTKYQSLLFDSEVCDWSMNNSSFDKRIFNKEHIVVLVEDEENNMFGFYNGTRISHYQYKVDNEWRGESVSCPELFLFSLQSNGRLEQPMKFDIKKTEREGALTLFKKDCPVLIMVGDGPDLCIKKEDQRTKCYCSQQSFEYDEFENVLCGKQGDNNPFECKRIRVFEMKETPELIQMKNELLQKQYEEETIRLQENSLTIQNEIPDDIKFIEELTETEFGELLFDTDCCNWDQYHTTFDKRLLEKEKIVFYIEDEEENVFGCYINTRIDKYRFYEEDEWKGERITDKKAFVFSLRSNGRSKEPMKFTIDNDCVDWAFQLYKQDWGVMFSIGAENDICIMKENMKDQCFCNQSSFDYKNHESIFVGKEGEDNPFTLKRMQVWQMIETDELKQKKKERETNQLQEMNEKILTQYQKEIQSVEKMCDLRYKELIFDTEICNWDQYTSTFDQRIYGKEQLVFLIEDTKGNMFGGFVNEKINRYEYYQKEQMKGRSIIDENAFVFALKSEGKEIKHPTKMNILPDEKNNAFTLYKQDWGVLFSFGGGNDIHIMKEKYKTGCYCIQQSFDYDGEKCVFVGKEDVVEPFTIQRLQVWQMDETEKQKQLREEKAKEVEEHKRKMKQKKFDEETEQMKLKESQIQEEYMKYIEEFTELKCQEILFDSNCCEWKTKTSTFDDRIIGKKQIAILLEEEKGNVFGLYFDTPIMYYMMKEDGEWVGEKNYGNKSFVFSIESNDRLDYPMKFEKQSGYDICFSLYKKEHGVLFSIGGGPDICIMKKDYRDLSYCKQFTFDYKGKERVFVGREKSRKPFRIERIRVLQMI